MKGRIEGKIEGKIEIAKKLITMGLDSGKISEATELSIAEIEDQNRNGGFGD